MSERKILTDYDPKPEVRKNAENARDWEYHEEAEHLYRMANLFKDRFLDPILLTDRRRLPDPVISFDDLRNKRTLAAYTVHRNPQGLLDEITFNTSHFKNVEEKIVWTWGKWAQLETLLHEQVHLWQQNFGEHPVKPGHSTHNKEFTDKCESLGLHPMPHVGCHIQVADGVFAQLMEELGIERPQDVPREEGAKPDKKDWFRPEKEKGRSTLSKFSCGCGERVRVGKKDWPGAICKACGTEYVKDDGLTHVIYDGRDDKEGSKKIVPQIIDKMNAHLQEGLPDNMQVPTVEAIAQKLGINENTLYGWVKSDQEFSHALERLIAVQKDDPFKTGTIEDSQVNTMMVALLLTETINRHYKPDNS